MERLKERLAAARRALETLEEVLNRGLSDAISRDAAIQRFEYTCETTWKVSQLFLKEKEGIETSSPKGIVRASFQVGLLPSAEVTERALTMVDDRNLTVHTYNEKLSQSLALRLPEHTKILKLWIESLSVKILH